MKWTYQVVQDILFVNLCTHRKSVEPMITRINIKIKFSICHVYLHIQLMGEWAGAYLYTPEISVTVLPPVHETEKLSI